MCIHPPLEIVPEMCSESSQWPWPLTFSLQTTWVHDCRPARRDKNKCTHTDWCDDGDNTSVSSKQRWLFTWRVQCVWQLDCSSIIPQTWLVKRSRSVLDDAAMWQLLLAQQFARLFITEVSALPRTEESWVISWHLNHTGPSVQQFEVGSKRWWREEEPIYLFSRRKSCNF